MVLTKALNAPIIHHALCQHTDFSSLLFVAWFYFCIDPNTVKTHVHPSQNHCIRHGFYYIRRTSPLDWQSGHPHDWVSIQAVAESGANPSGRTISKSTVPNRCTSIRPTHNSAHLSVSTPENRATMRQNRKVRHAVPQIRTVVRSAAWLRIRYLRIGKMRDLSLIWMYINTNIIQVASASRALEKLSGHQVGSKTMVIRLAKNINYDELDRTHGARSRLEHSVGVSSSAASSSKSNSAGAASTAATAAQKLTTHNTIQAIEAKLRSLEQNNAAELVINNRPAIAATPLIHRYQYNNPQHQQQNGAAGGGYRDGRGGGPAGRYSSIKNRYAQQGPYSRRGGASGPSHRRW